MERDLFQGAISAVSNPFYAIDATCYKIRMAIAASIAPYRNDAGADGETVSVRLFIAELVIIEKCQNINFAKAISDTKVTSYQSIGTMFGS